MKINKKLFVLMAALAVGLSTVMFVGCKSEAAKTETTEVEETEEVTEEVAEEGNYVISEYTLEQLNCSACPVMSLTTSTEGTAKAEYSGDVGSAEYIGTYNADATVNLKRSKVIEGETTDLPSEIKILLTNEKAWLDFKYEDGNEITNEPFKLTEN